MISVELGILTRIRLLIRNDWILGVGRLWRGDLRPIEGVLNLDFAGDHDEV